MTKQHPITPPQELIDQLREDCPYHVSHQIVEWLATETAKWELEACEEWLAQETPEPYINALRAARRKPKTLAEEALEELQLTEGAMYSAGLGCDFTATRRALERLQELENNQ